MICSPRKTSGLFNDVTTDDSCDGSKFTQALTVPDDSNARSATCYESAANDPDQIIQSPTESFEVFGTIDCDDVNLDALLEYEIFTNLNTILDSENLQPDTSGSNIIELSAAVSDVLPSCSDDFEPSTVDYSYFESATDSCTDELVELSNEDIKHIQYLERRRKNNAASKKSRESKKRRLVEMEDQTVVLEHDNDKLKQRIVELERLVGTMKSVLVQAVSANKA